MVCVLKVRLQSYDCLLRHFLNLPLEVSDVLSSLVQIFEHARHQLLGALIVVFKVVPRCTETLAVLVERKVGQVHVQIFDVGVIWFLVVVSCESGKTLAT